MRHTEQLVVDRLALPMPFQYYHLVNSLLLFSLLLWAAVPPAVEDSLLGLPTFVGLVLGSTEIDLWFFFATE